MPSSDTMTIYRGEDARLTFTMSPVEDITGWTLLLTVRGGGESFTADGVVDSGPSGTFHFDLDDVDTDLLAPGSYSYDVWRVDADSEQPIALGTLNLIAGPRDTTV